MTTTVDLYGIYGRLGNQIIRNLAVSLLAEKFDLYAVYSNENTIEALGIPLYSGKNIYNNVITLHDNNYFDIYNSENLNSNLDGVNAYFQSKDISTFLYNYLHTESIKSNIISKNPFKNRYNTNNDLFVHIRLTDVAHLNPGIGYYLNTIRNIQFDNLFIATDQPSHTMIRQLREYYPNVNIIIYNEIDTIQFGSTCKHVVLSHGSFSGIIGYLSFFSTIHYPEYDETKRWYGDMFSIEGWIKHSHTTGISH
jgi:hypothetical protein